ncbi:MAG TPA: peptidase S8, partial [Pilimelia sp.]|nr:peptidase S8 [Pilimelia sp.]
MSSPGAGPPPDAASSAAADDAASMAAVVLVGLWAAALTGLVQGAVWFGDQLLLASGRHLPGWGWPLAALVNAGLVAVPAGVLAAARRSAAMRAAGRAWLLGAAALAGLGAVRAVPVLRHEAYLAALAGLAAAGGWLLRRTYGAPAGRRPAVTGYAVAGGLAVLLPWAWLGALGGPTETVLAALAAAALGWFAGQVLDGRFWAGFAVAGTGPVPRGGRLVLLGGFTAGVALLLVGAGVGAAGAHLATVALLPALGFAAGALVRAQLATDAAAGPPAGRTGTPPGFPPGPVARPGLAALIGLVALGPLAFVDPE